MLHNVWHCCSSLAIFTLLLRQGFARIPADQFPVSQQPLNPVQGGEDAGTLSLITTFHMLQPLTFVDRLSVLF